MTNTTRALWAGWLCLALLGLGCDDGMDDPLPGDDLGEGGAGGTPLPDGAAGVEADAAPDAEIEPPDPVAELIAAVDLTRYSADLEFISRDGRMTLVGANWQATQDRCAEVFAEAGLEVLRQPLSNGGVNVIGRLPGIGSPDEKLVVGAHYDSEFECAGADDNASGVAGVLEAARVLSTRRYDRTIEFVCIDSEELEFLGSIDYARRARAAGDDIRGALILEMIGYTSDMPGSQGTPEGFELFFPAPAAAIAERESRGDFMFFVGDDDPEMLSHLQPAAEAAGLPLIGVQFDQTLRESPLTSQFRRSDHNALWVEGYPAIMLTDTAEFRNLHYHCTLGDDDIDTIDLDFAVATTAATVGAVAAMAGPTDGPAPETRALEPGPVAEVPPLACDHRAGECDDGQRCMILVGEDPRLGCWPMNDEQLGLDAPCEWDDEGRDTCAPGLWCSSVGTGPDGGRRCRPLCQSADDCAEGEACPWLGIEIGSCTDPCDPLGADCPDGTACTMSVDNDRNRYGLFCGSAGEVPEGQPCGGDDRCQPGLMCGTTFSLPDDIGCVKWCRPSAPDCAAGRTCRRIPRDGLPADLGVCLPDDRLLP